ncbi:hypothetical protein BDA96_02G260600 [Sorghum bicolor]|uniref:Uncharacterized protein n=2 Tax=Sorghum bicolor TaxID=4558 RepID=A0A921RR49_SORBI|nr:hypothetical protein BDA96_02G260600 [Sorghum bicolor]OQU89699.1 hypothetical protein SORBI_3002G249101 [Sorghum bicolor]
MTTRLLGPGCRLHNGRTPTSKQAKPWRMHEHGRGQESSTRTALLHGLPPPLPPHSSSSAGPRGGRRRRTSIRSRSGPGTGRRGRPSLSPLYFTLAPGQRLPHEPRRTHSPQCKWRTFSPCLLLNPS